MKYLIGIFAIMFSQTLFSQDLQYTIDYINKIYVKERTFFDTNNSYNNTFAPIYDTGPIYIRDDDSIINHPVKILKNPHLNRKYEKQVLDYLQNYMLDSLPNIQKVTFDLIYSVGKYSKKKRIRRRAVNMLLDMANLPLVGKDDLISFKKEDFNKKAREKLKDVIRGKKTDTAIYYIVEYSIRKVIKNKAMDDQIKYISKRDSLPYEFVRDSMFKDLRQLNIEEAKRRIRGHTHIRLAGKIYMYDFMPDLKQMLNDKQRYGEQFFDIKCALARMGDTVMEKKLLSSRSFDNYEYINTQRALSKLIEKLYTDETLKCFFGQETVSKANFIHLRLQVWILNFPKNLKVDKTSACDFTKEDLKKVEKTKIWLKENRSKLKLKEVQ